MRVLIADDDPVARCLVEAQLRRWGYDVSTVGNGPDALRALLVRGGPRIALLDWMMPELDGLEICRQVRAHPCREVRYLILLTSHGGPESVAEGLEAGADDFITKPFDARELRARLGVAARVAKLEDQLHERVCELQEALANVERLQGLLPICSYCHSVRPDENYWQRLDQYVAEHADVTFSHGICPQCFETHMQPELDKIGA
jgi:sigma-B regulation protein RsbU (phosphoserine phosphatase)